MTTTTVGNDRLIWIDYDHEARASYQRFSDKSIVGTEEHEDGSLIDIAEDGTVVGIERLY